LSRDFLDWSWSIWSKIESLRFPCAWTGVEESSKPWRGATAKWSIWSHEQLVNGVSSSTISPRIDIHKLHKVRYSLFLDNPREGKFHMLQNKQRMENISVDFGGATFNPLGLRKHEINHVGSPLNGRFDTNPEQQICGESVPSESLRFLRFDRCHAGSGDSR
jgi:hypothetical protein